MITAAPPKTRSWALPLVCLGAALLYAGKIGDGQVGNTYSAAAVKSMTSGFTWAHPAPLPGCRTGGAAGPPGRRAAPSRAAGLPGFRTAGAPGR